MNVARVQAALDAAWSAAVLGAIVIVARRQIAPVLVKLRADLDARTAAVAAEAERSRKLRAYLGAIRETLIREEHDCGCVNLGMEP